VTALIVLTAAGVTATLLVLAGAEWRGTGPTALLVLWAGSTTAISSRYLLHLQPDDSARQRPSNPFERLPTRDRTREKSSDFVN
jgi:hypothetical protein